MRNIPANLDKYQVKGLLAQKLHGPAFFNGQRNFDVHLFKPSEHDRNGVVMIPDPIVGERFLKSYGTSNPGSILFMGNKRISFEESRREPPSPDQVQTIGQTPWMDPTWEREREQKEKNLSEMFVALQSIQFGWMCRDDVFSIESEARQPALLRFDHIRRELHVTVSEAYNSPTEYVIAIRQPSIMVISCHASRFDQQTVIFLQLEIPPAFFNRHVPIPGVKKQDPYQRLTTFPLVNNPDALPYASLALRLVLLSPTGTEAFGILADLANMRNMVKSFPVEVARRDLFSRNRLQRMDISIRQLDSWAVAFQLEGLVRNLSVDGKEAVELVPEVKELMNSHGKPFVAKLLRQFSPRAKEFLPEKASSTIVSYLKSFVEEFRAQGDLEADTPSNPNFYASLHVMITPTSMFLSGPFIDQSNRVIRRYSQASQENFLRVEFRDENNLQYRFDRDVNGEEFIKDRVGPIMRDGLVIAGRRFRFLAYSQSALKEHSVW